MPTYCDECEAVIDRDEELTRIEGNDYCLDCTPTERTEMTATLKPATDTALRNGDIIIFGTPARCEELRVWVGMDDYPDREVYGYANHCNSSYMPHIVISCETYRSRDGSIVSTSGGPCPFSTAFTYTREADREAHAWAWQGDKGDGVEYGMRGAGLGEPYTYTARVWRVMDRIDTD